MALEPLFVWVLGWDPSHLLRQAEHQWPTHSNEEILDPCFSATGAVFASFAQQLQRSQILFTPSETLSPRAPCTRQIPSPAPRRRPRASTTRRRSKFLGGATPHK